MAVVHSNISSGCKAHCVQNLAVAILPEAPLFHPQPHPFGSVVKANMHSVQDTFTFSISLYLPISEWAVMRHPRTRNLPAASVVFSKTFSQTRRAFSVSLDWYSWSPFSICCFVWSWPISLVFRSFIYQLHVGGGWVQKHNNVCTRTGRCVAWFGSSRLQEPHTIQLEGMSVGEECHQSFWETILIL